MRNLCPHPVDQQMYNGNAQLVCGCCGQLVLRDLLAPGEPIIAPTRTREELMADYRAQCVAHKHPDFLSRDGRCFNCYYDFTQACTIVPAYNTTGCPSCHRSYCE